MEHILAYLLIHKCDSYVNQHVVSNWYNEGCTYLTYLHTYVQFPAVNFRICSFRACLFQVCVCFKVKELKCRLLFPCGLIQFLFHSCCTGFWPWFYLTVMAVDVYCAITVEINMLFRLNQICCFNSLNSEEVNSFVTTIRVVFCRISKSLILLILSFGSLLWQAIFLSFRHLFWGFCVFFNHF